MKTLKFLCSVVALSAAMFVQAQTQVIAHRGFWDCEGSAQNSITALRNAASLKLYGSEFDVHLTADKAIVVNHDHIIQGHKISKTKLRRLRKLHLRNGERLSTLDEYLKEGKKHPQLQLILEAKPQDCKENEDYMAQQIVEKVKKYGLEQQVEYISFSMNLCEQLKKLSPEAEVAFLNGDLSPKEIKEKGLTGIDYHYNVFFKHPEWIQEAHDLGLKVNSWTVNSAKDMKKLKELQIDYLTTNDPITAQKIVVQ